MMDWITGSDGSESEPVATDGLGFDDEMGDFDDAGDDMDGLDDGMGDFDDDMGGFGGDAGDEMDGLDGDMGGFGDGTEGLDDAGGDLGGTEIDPDTIAEMEDRISELENELSSTTSEMSTVREENKQIGETVEELDDTVRKLLDIYEMVTRGINPFVDDAREMGGLESEGAFGLFEMEEESNDSLDPDVADADAEAFFDEDFGDIDANEDEAELAAGDELAGDEREDPAAALDGDDSTNAGGGTSFDELKSEYEENGEWDEVADDEDAESDLDEAVAEEPFDADGIDDPDADDAFGSDNDEADGDDGPGDRDEANERGADEMEAESTGSDEGGADEMEADKVEAESTGSDEVEADEVEADRVAADEVEAGRVKADQVEADEFVQSDPVDPEDARGASPGAETNGVTNGHAGPDSSVYSTAAAEHDADAYLTRIPARYTAESVVLEWTQFLVDVGGVVGAVRALRQYREQGWITRQVERTVGEHVRNAAAAGGTEETRDLRVRDHQESLTYISRLAGDVEKARLLEELSALGGGARGIRR
ncbi:flagella accessory protein C [Halobellus salinus]|nr:flagella accessory protein C [Halobellus salinus]